LEWKGGGMEGRGRVSWNVMVCYVEKVQQAYIRCMLQMHYAMYNFYSVLGDRGNVVRVVYLRYIQGMHTHTHTHTHTVRGLPPVSPASPASPASPVSSVEPSFLSLFTWFGVSPTRSCVRWWSTCPFASASFGGVHSDAALRRRAETPRPP